MKPNKNLKWLKLDNAAKIYPAVSSKRTTAVFRLSATLKQDINNKLLQKALLNIMPRFPYFKMRIKTGFFWSYLEEYNQNPTIKKETLTPCRKISKKNDNNFLFRVLYFEKKISVEFSHILTDGTGGLCFLKALIAEYLSVNNVKAANWGHVFNLSEKPDKTETEDAYIKYYNKDIPYPEKKLKAFHLPDNIMPKEYYNIITGIINVDQIKNITKKHNVSITEFLTALYLFSLQEYIFLQPQAKIKKIIKPIRILVPVNLRNLYKSKTIRNFFLSVTPGIDIRLGRYTLDEIIKIVYHYMRIEVNEKFINQQIARNVSGEKYLFVRLIPRLLKIPIEKFLYKFISSSQHSGLLTNVGIVKMPIEFSKEIERFEFIANPNAYTKLNCGIISFKDKIYISFGNLIENTEVQRIFFSKLRDMEVQVKIETNYL